MPDLQNGIDTENLARHLARFMCPDGLMTAADVGGLWGGRSPRYVIERLAKVEGFPKPVRLPLPGGKVGDPMWRREDITAYIQKLAEPVKPGRPRRALVSL